MKERKDFFVPILIYHGLGYGISYNLYDNKTEIPYYYVKTSLQ